MCRLRSHFQRLTWVQAQILRNWDVLTPLDGVGKSGMFITDCTTGFPAPQCEKGILMNRPVRLVEPEGFGGVYSDTK